MADHSAVCFAPSKTERCVLYACLLLCKPVKQHAVKPMAFFGRVRPPFSFAEIEAVLLAEETGLMSGRQPDQLFPDRLPGAEQVYKTGQIQDEIDTLWEEGGRAG